MKRRDPASYARKPAFVDPYDMVLIVCEGRKTEPLYFKGLQSIHRVTSANISVVSPAATDPLSLVNYAERKASASEYSSVFCVFARDGHSNYDDALRRVAELSSAGLPIHAVTSWPCFEFWYLLHFAYLSRPFERTPGASSCDRVIRELRKYIFDYGKNSGELYRQFLPYRDAAIQHAGRLVGENRTTATKNPHTKVHYLVR